MPVWVVADIELHHTLTQLGQPLAVRQIVWQTLLQHWAEFFPDRGVLRAVTLGHLLEQGQDLLDAHRLDVLDGG